MSDLKSANIEQITFAGHGLGYNPSSNLTQYSNEGAGSFRFASPHKDFNTALLNTINGELLYNYSANGKSLLAPYLGGNLFASATANTDRAIISDDLRNTELKKNWWLDPFAASGNSAQNAASSLSINTNYLIDSIISSLIGSTPTNRVLSAEITEKALIVAASSWSGSIQITLAAKASNNGDRLDAKQIDFNSPDMAGSVMQGGNGNDQLWGKAGWDILDGSAGNDLIRAGNGRDILIGGLGADELHGDFGWNTYKSEKDGFSDLIAIKSDQYLVNWIYGKAGNNSDGAKCDIIEGLDAIDKIKIIGVDNRDITFAANVTAKGLTGIGIYGNGALEALYTGGDLTINQITQMTSGDASAAAMANQVNSYGTW